MANFAFAANRANSMGRSLPFRSLNPPDADSLRKRPEFTASLLMTEVTLAALPVATFDRSAKKKGDGLEPVPTSGLRFADD
jgi:hypothetical protein